jgi:hypothetical protein
VDDFDPNEASEFLTYLHHHMEKHYDSEVAVTKVREFSHTLTHHPTALISV